MEEKNISELLSQQKEFWLKGGTADLEFRVNSLKKLRKCIADSEEKIVQAVHMDLKKPEFEFYVSEMAMVRAELSHHIGKLKRWAKPKKVRGGLLQFKSSSYIRHEPHGQVLIVAPWNYPFQLVFIPLTGALSAGNTVIIKPSPDAPATAKVMEEIVRTVFPYEYVAVVQGGKEVNSFLFNQKFDLIFFTGSPSMGRIVMEAASRHLTPVILELGGKSPCVVHNDADLDLAAKRIVWGKNVNAGQTCTAPDYLMVHSEVKNALLEKMKKYIKVFFGDNPSASDSLSRIVSDKHMKRLSALIKSGDIVCGGETDHKERFIAPTLIDNVRSDDPLMREEIFGPILPVIQYQDVSHAVDFINNRPRPLALYIFTNDTKIREEMISRTSSGGVTVNDTLMHVTNHRLPFGGTGESGMGNYHGKFSFDTFSRMRSVMIRSNRVEFPFRYAPYSKGKMTLMKAINGHFGFLR